MRYMLTANVYSRGFICVWAALAALVILTGFNWRQNARTWRDIENSYEAVSAAYRLRKDYEAVISVEKKYIACLDGIYCPLEHPKDIDKNLNLLDSIQNKEFVDGHFSINHDNNIEPISKIEFIESMKRVREALGLKKWLSSEQINLAQKVSHKSELKQSVVESVIALNELQNFVHKDYSYRKYEIESAPPPPNRKTYSLYMIDNMGWYAEFSLSVFAIIFSLWSFISRIFSEKSKGWLRLSLVLSIVIALSFGAYNAVKYNDAYADIMLNYVFNAAFSSFIFSLFVLFYGKDIFCWIAAGFSRDKATQKRAADGGKAACPAIQNSSGPSAGAAKFTEAPEATFWARLHSRCIDFSILWLFAVAVLLAVDDFLPPLGIWTITVKALVIILIMCLATLAYDTICIWKFGTTMGKAIAGLRVVDEANRSISSSSARVRAYRLVSSGLLFYILFPMAQTFEAIFNYFHLRKGNKTHWDRVAETRVVQLHIPTFQTFIVSVAAWLMIISVMMMVRAPAGL